MKLLTALIATLIVGACADQPRHTFTPAELQAQQAYVQSFGRPYYPSGTPSAPVQQNCFTTRNALGYSTTCR